MEGAWKSSNFAPNYGSMRKTVEVGATLPGTYHGA